MRFVASDGSTRDLAFADVAAAAARWTGLLRSLGLEPGDRLLVLVGKRPEWRALMLGALQGGFVTVPCAAQLRPRTRPRLPRPPLRRAPARRRAVRPRRGRADGRAAAGALPRRGRFAARRASRPRRSARHRRARPRLQPLHLRHDQGPEGRRPHARLLRREEDAGRAWLDARSADLDWCTASTGWAKPIWNVLLGPWSRGAATCLHEGGFDPAERFAPLHELGVTVLCQAPTEFRLMAKAGGLDRYDLSSLRHAVSAGEPLNPEAIATFRDAFARRSSAATGTSPATAPSATTTATSGSRAAPAT